MESHIKDLIINYVRSYPKSKQTATSWQDPLIAFAAANDNLFESLKQKISPTHALPTEFLATAQSVITYFIPFIKETVTSNVEGLNASREWALAYVETNQLITDLNAFVCDKLHQQAYDSVSIPRTYNYDKQHLINDWSHRHIAFIAGLGKFGLNNMLITEKGCCGRIGSIVTNVKLPPTPRSNRENCLFKYNGLCKKCVDRCVTNALTETKFDRFACHEMCLKNGEIFKELGTVDFCGKCLVNLPCSFITPTTKLP